MKLTVFATAVLSLSYSLFTVAVYLDIWCSKLVCFVFYTVTGQRILRCRLFVDGSIVVCQSLGIHIN